LLHRVRKQVRRGMANDVEPLRVLFGDDGNPAVVLEPVGEVDHLAVDLAGESRLGETRADRSRDFSDGDRVIERLLGSVRKGDDWHGWLRRTRLLGGVVPRASLPWTELW